MLALVLLLALGAVATRPGVAYTSDEGAGVLQARLIHQTGAWRYDYPLVGLDSEELARPFIRGSTGTAGIAPYAKHPLYPLVLSGAEDLAGGAGGLILSVAGTVLAAVGAARLARRFGAHLDVAALWVVGVGSPLLFDGWLVLAHSMVAATTVWAVVTAVRWLDGRPPRVWSALVGTVGLAALVATGGMLRTEALLVGPALAGALVLQAVVAARGGQGDDASNAEAGVRPAVSAVLAPAGAALAGTMVAWGIDRTAEHAIVGASVAQPGVSPAGPSSWLAGRMEGLVATWLDPSYHGAASDGLVVLGLVSLVVGALLWRMGRAGPGAAALAVGAGLYAAAALGAPGGAVPGLLMAFPLLAVGVALADGRLVATPAQQVVVATTVAMALAVLATQYHYGGGVEWGGRFFAVIVPLAAPVAVAAVANTAGDLGWRQPATRVGIGALAVVAVVLAGMALDAQRSVHGAGWDALDRVRAAAAVAGPTASPTGRPVVVSDNRLLPQILYPGFDEVDWVVPQEDHLARYLDRLPDAGIERAVLVVGDATEALDDVDGWTVVDGRSGAGLDVVVIEHQR